MPVIFWIIITGMALGAAALIAMPLLRSRKGDASRGAHALEVYRLQLMELDGELARNVISSDEALAARLEIERRMLRADDEDQASTMSDIKVQGGGFWARRGLQAGAMAAAVITPLMAVSVYLMFGSPDLAPNQDGTQVAGADPEHMDMVALTEKLAARLAMAPQDIQGWMLLGRSYATLENFPKAIEAYAKAVALAGDKPAPLVLAEYAETLVQGANGLVGEEAQLQFRKVLKIIPTEPRSLFYLGLAKAQAGDPRGALEDWVTLLKQAEPGAPWVGAVREQAQEVANLLKADLAGLLAVDAPPPVAAPDAIPAVPRSGPDANDIASAATLPEKDRKQMIEDMVARLAARQESSDKDNVDGWLQLARAYGVLGRDADRLAALARAVAAGPERIDALSAYGEALQATGETRPVSERFATTMRQILSLEPENNQALWFLGVFLAQNGDMAGARGHWERLLGQLRADSEEYRSVSTALQQLGKPE